MPPPVRSVSFWASSGSAITEMAVLSDLPRSVNCVSVDEVLALRLERDDSLEMLADRPARAMGVIKIFTQRLYEATQRLA